MKTYKLIADGEYVRERRKEFLMPMGIWAKMTDEEKEFFRRCRRCKAYDVYAEDKDNIACPCTTCEHHKTEMQVDNIMISLRNKYW